MFVTLRQFLADRELRILHRHLEPDTPLASRIADDFDALSRLRGQDFGKGGVIDRLGHDDRRRHRALDVMLLEERGNDLGELLRIGVLREERTVADVAAAADHHDIDGNESLLRCCRDDVDVPRRRTLDELPRLQLRQPGDLVA